MIIIKFCYSLKKETILINYSSSWQFSDNFLHRLFDISFNTEACPGFFSYDKNKHFLSENLIISKAGTPLASASLSALFIRDRNLLLQISSDAYLEETSWPSRENDPYAFCAGLVFDAYVKAVFILKLWFNILFASLWCLRHVLEG